MNKMITIGNKNFELGKKTYIMGILNVTPDSFSDGGRFNNVDTALNHVQQMIEQGVDIIDIGGESTRPNYTLIPDDEELERVLPVIAAIKKEFDIPLSIDTYKSYVAECAVKEGIDLINDIWGFKKDPKMAQIAAKLNVPCCLMHNRDNKEYENFLADVIKDLKASVNIALSAGVKPENIILDPGIGFAKTYEQNLEMMNNLELLPALGYPVLLATSKKSMIGTTLNLPPDERIEGTVATTVLGITKGCDFVRVHNVLENKRAAIMTDAIVRR